MMNEITLLLFADLTEGVESMHAGTPGSIFESSLYLSGPLDSGCEVDQREGRTVIHCVDPT